GSSTGDTTPVRCWRRRTTPFRLKMNSSTSSFLTSVFTHMLPEDFERYLCEIKRVMKPGGRFLASYVLINEEAIQQMADGKTAFTVEHDCGPYWTPSLEQPEGLVAYREEFVLQLYEKLGLQVWQPMHYGGWAGRNPSEESQDVIIAGRQQAG